MRKARLKFVFALVGIAFLLLNPAGACAGNPMSNSSSHPCCPHAPEAAKSSCICIDRQPAAPSLPSASSEAQFEAVTPAPVVLTTAQVPGWEVRPPEAAAFAPLDIVLSFHQLLL